MTLPPLETRNAATLLQKWFPTNRPFYMAQLCCMLKIVERRGLEFSYKHSCFHQHALVKCVPYRKSHKVYTANSRAAPIGITYLWKPHGRIAGNSKPYINRDHRLSPRILFPTH